MTATTRLVAPTAHRTHLATHLGPPRRPHPWQRWAMEIEHVDQGPPLGARAALVAQLTDGRFVRLNDLFQPGTAAGGRLTEGKTHAGSPAFGSRHIG